MKSQRLLELVLRLQARSPRPARELAAAMGVTPRTIYRDIDTLSAAGIPVYALRGAQGGIGLVEGYRQAISQFNEDEIQALFVGGSGALSDFGATHSLAPAREKLLGALSERQRAAAIKVSERIWAEPRAWSTGVIPAGMMAKLRRAIWEDRTLRIGYRDQKGLLTDRRLDPLGLVSKAGCWYLVARHDLRILTFRIERIQTLDVTLSKFIRPAGFRLDDYWNQSSRKYESSGAASTVRVRGHRRDLDQLAALWPTECHDADASVADTAIADVRFVHRGQAVHELLAWSSRLEILTPPDIRSEVVERLAAAMVRYALAPHQSSTRAAPRAAKRKR